MKYRIDPTARRIYGSTCVFQIIAVRDIGRGASLIRAGTCGGWVQSELNLPHEGTCWVYDQAIVMDRAIVRGSARVEQYAVVGHLARVSGAGRVRGHAVVCEAADVGGHAIVAGHAVIRGYAKLRGTAHVRGNVVLSSGVHTEGVLA